MRNRQWSLPITLAILTGLSAVFLASALRVPMSDSRQPLLLILNVAMIATAFFTVFARKFGGGKPELLITGDTLHWRLSPQHMLPATAFSAVLLLMGVNSLMNPARTRVFGVILVLVGILGLVLSRSTTFATWVSPATVEFESKALGTSERHVIERAAVTEQWVETGTAGAAETYRWVMLFPPTAKHPDGRYTVDIPDFANASADEVRQLLGLQQRARQ